MSLISAGLGLILYLLAKTIHLPIVEVCAFTVALGLAFLVAAVAIGAQMPCFSSALYQASVLLPWTLGAGLSCAIIFLTVLILAWKTSPPVPSVDAFGAAVVAVLALLSQRFGGMDLLLPERLAARFIKWKYENRFPQLNGKDSQNYVQAYEAIFHPSLSDNKGAIKGWGYTSTCRRLELIRNAL